MKTFKMILRILILFHVFPITGILLAHDNNLLKGYFTGWIINGFILGIILAVIFLIWLFINDDDDYDYYY